MRKIEFNQEITRRAIPRKSNPGEVKSLNRSFRKRTSLKSMTFAFSEFDMDEVERIEPKDLFLCVQLYNNENVIIKIGTKTTAKQVIARLKSYRKVKELYAKAQELELVLSVCLSLNIESQPLPNYFAIFRLNSMGFWTKPNNYTNCPLLTLQVKQKSSTPDSEFTLPEVLQCSMDQLVHGGRAPNWSSNSGEAIAFRLKYPLNDVWEPKDTIFARYPEFFDSQRDPFLDSQSHVINVTLAGLKLTETSLVITSKTTLREALQKIKEKVEKLNDSALDVNKKMLKIVGLSEFIWSWDIPLVQSDGIREALRTHQTPWLTLIDRPDYLQSKGSLPTFHLYDLIVPMVTSLFSAIFDNLDLTCFPENDIELDDDEGLLNLIRSRSTALPDIQTYIEKRSTIFKSTIFLHSPSPLRKRPKTLIPGIENRRKKTAEKCFSELKESSSANPEFSHIIDVRSLHKFFRIKIVGIENLRMFAVNEESGNPDIRLNPDRVRVEISLFSGSVRLEAGKSTPIALASRDIRGNYIDTVRWQDWVTFQVLYSQLPFATMLKFTVFAHCLSKSRASDTEKVVAWVNFRVFNYANRMETGVHRIGLYPYYSVQDSTGSTTMNSDPNASQLFIELESFLQPVVFASDIDATFDLKQYLKSISDPIPDQDRIEIERVINEHPLYELQPWESALLWEHRAWVSTTKGLPKLLESVDWCKPQCVRDIHFILSFCKLQEPIVGLELLDGKFADCKVRDYAVKCLEKMTNYECQLYLVQLVQALKFEPYHDSALARFLMRKAIKRPHTIGHTFFWLLRSEMEEPYFQERFGLLLEQFVRKCGSLHDTLVFEDYLIRHLLGLAKTVQKNKQESEEALTAFIQEELAAFNEEMPEFYPLAFNPKMRVKRIKVEECKFMKSKKRPLYLVFENLEEGDEDVHVLFKTGDDLRQDLLVLQMMRLMESLWAEQGLNLKLSLYHCMPLASEAGMVEIVQRAKTLAYIHNWRGQRGVFSEKTLTMWMDQHTEEYQMDNFIKSCAGYSVGMYVLGVADRHSDNIMIKDSGHVFHIDFGHFLGYFKKKLGIKRETAPFVFTPDFRYTMGGKHSEGYREFTQLCVKAYNVIRHNRRLFITLLCLMLCSGIPEITRRDIGYLLKTLPITVSDEAAGEIFLKTLKQALKSTMTRINFYIHLLANY